MASDMEIFETREKLRGAVFRAIIEHAYSHRDENGGGYDIPDVCPPIVAALDALIAFERAEATSDHHCGRDDCDAEAAFDAIVQATLEDAV